MEKMNDMDYALSSATQRRIKILNLLREAADWRYIDKIAEIINCSKKTLISDLEYIEERWSDVVVIESVNRKGIRMTVKPSKSMHTIYYDLMRESPAFSLLESVFFTPDKTSKYWAEKLFLSESSLYRIAKNLERSIEAREMHLLRSPYRITGKNERQIRCFFASYFFEVYGAKGWPFPLDKNLVYNLVEKINMDLQLNYNDFQYVELAYSIVVTFIRESQGNLIKIFNRENPQYQKRMEEMKKYKKDILRIVDALGEKVPRNWYEDFTYSIFWWEFAWDNPQEESRIEALGYSLLNTVKNALSIPIDETSTKNIVAVIQRIYVMHKLYPYKRYIIYNRELFSSTSIKRHFTFFTAVVKKALKQKEEKQKFPWYTLYFDEILYGFMLLWENLPNLLEGLRQQIKVGVFSDLGPKHAELLAIMLYRNFEGKIEITIQDRPFHKMKKKPENFELHVTNISLQGIPEEKQVIIEDVPTSKNLIDLRHKIEKERQIIPQKVPFLNT